MLIFISPIILDSVFLPSATFQLTALCCDVQTELNSREGAWERLCMERDPLVLSCLMWSWLEQLKDPIISSEDIKALSEKNVNPQNALDSLEKVDVLAG